MKKLFKYLILPLVGIFLWASLVFGANVAVLVVAGGDNGWNNSNTGYGDGGPAGDVAYNATYAVSPQVYAITVGAAQQNSVFDSITAVHGHANGYTYGTDSDLAFGGGPGAGSNGGGASGTTGGSGGTGYTSSISGVSHKYGGGGGGQGYLTGTGGSGSDGGGNGGIFGTATSAYYYGSGGGGDYNAPGNGYQGIVIIRYKTSDFGTCTVSGTGNTLATAPDDSNYTVVTMIVGGNFTVVAAGGGVSGTQRKVLMF
jgi:hypothetical protein